MNCNYSADSKNVEILVDQIGQNTKKWAVSTQNESRTLFITSQPVNINERRQK